MTWQLAIMLQAFLSALSTITFRFLAREKLTANASLMINAAVYVSLYLCFIIVCPLVGNVNLTEFNVYWLRFIAGGLAFALTNVCTYKSFSYFDASIGSIVGTINAIFTVILASLVLGENLSLYQGLGSFVLLLSISYGVLTTQSRKNKLQKRTVRLGIMYALLASMFFAMAAVNEKSLLSSMSFSTYGIIGVGWQAIMALLIAVIFQRNKAKVLLVPKVLGISLLSGVFRGLGGLAFIFAEIKSNNVAIVSVISNFRLIIVMILGYWILKERDYLKEKVFSTLASISSLGIIFWK